MFSGWQRMACGLWGGTLRGPRRAEYKEIAVEVNSELRSGSNRS